MVIVLSWSFEKLGFFHLIYFTYLFGNKHGVAQKIKPLTSFNLNFQAIDSTDNALSEDFQNPTKLAWGNISEYPRKCQVTWQHSHLKSGLFSKVSFVAATFVI